MDDQHAAFAAGQGLSDLPLEYTFRAFRSVAMELDALLHGEISPAKLRELVERDAACAPAASVRLELEAWGRICETKDMRIGIDTFIKEGPRAQAPFEHC